MGAGTVVWCYSGGGGGRSRRRRRQKIKPIEGSAAEAVCRTLCCHCSHSILLFSLLSGGIHDVVTVPSLLLLSLSRPCGEVTSLS